MADAQHKLSRRALLGAPLLPLILSGAERSKPVLSLTKGTVSKDAPLRQNWSRALAAFRRADAAVSALEGTPDDDAFNRAADAHDRALERLLLAPAPHLAPLADKLRLARRHQAWELPSGDALMDALEQDARRLSFRSS